MKSYRPSPSLSVVALFICFLHLGLCHVSSATVSAVSNRATYIVHYAKSQMPSTFGHHSEWYGSSLRSVSDSVEMLYTYDNAIHGFSTRLTPEEAQSLSTQPGIMLVLPELRYELHTTRTPEFLGLARDLNFLPESNSATDVVVGVLDTGVWPESKSFDDTGFGPVPAGWKGSCVSGTNFTAANCNKKLIGAKYFAKGYEATMGPVDESKESKSARDDDGHGTHTASTAAGSIVSGASLLGYAAGNARGMAPRARVAIYKVCWTGGCFSSDILAAIDAAISDNVDVLSMSLGGGMSDYNRDSVAIGSYAAMEKGVFISCSGGNGGPTSNSLSNVAPWITTVGAGTLDRDFPAFVVLGDGKNYSGVSLYKGTPLPRGPLSFIYAGNATNASNGNLCMPGTLIHEKVKGKIVFCDRGVSARVQKGAVVKEAGGAGMVLANTAANGEELVADAHLLPATAVGEKAGNEIRKYAVSAKNPTATILFEGTVVGIKPSPVVAAFSSRGPNSITPEILKPDMIAPGVNILAGWSGNVGPTGLASDSRRVEFNIISGTSMSCPHVSGLAALIKAAHPEWSPAAIRSALMTTAYTAYKNGKPILDIATGKASTPFDHGAGHVDPTSALDPGLVYDLSPRDYLDFLCALNYTETQIKSVARVGNSTCDPGKKYSVADLNYPSFMVIVETKVHGEAAAQVYKHMRTVTSVGGAGTYRASVMSESTAVKISVKPPELKFQRTNEKKAFTVTFSVSSSGGETGKSSFGRIEWSDGKHVVGSPVAVSWT